MAIKTPTYNLTAFPNVYEPSEDTFLFLDALESDLPKIVENKPEFVVEIGCGSGVVISALASVLGDNLYFATDINDEACRATAHTAELNNIRVESCRMDLLSCFRKRIFDLIIFNPPYVVTDSDEIKGSGLSRAWAGGIDGREITDKVLLKLDELLSDKGVCYMVLVKDNKPDEVCDLIIKCGLCPFVVKERKVLGEHLFVLRINRRKK